LDCDRQGWALCISFGIVIGVWCIHEICNERESKCLGIDDKWVEHFPKNKWTSKSIGDGGIDLNTMNTLLISQQHVRNLQVLQAHVYL
jgi:hypothetical protein